MLWPSTRGLTATAYCSMKAKRIKKLRSRIRHYYVCETSSLFGIYTGKQHMIKCGGIIYGLNPRDAILRARRHFAVSRGDSFYGNHTTYKWAHYATMPVDKPYDRCIEYWN